MVLQSFLFRLSRSELALAKKQLFYFFSVGFSRWKKNKCAHYSISNRKSYSILQVARMFSSNIKMLPPRKGERFASALTSMNLTNKVFKMFGKINLKDYVNNITKSQIN